MPAVIATLPTWYRLIRQEEITVLHFVPSMLRAFTEHPGLETLTSVRFLALIGEPLPSRLAAKVLEALPKARIRQFLWTYRGDDRRQRPYGLSARRA